MRPQQLVLRCYAERVGNQWQAFCLDFCLAVQADSVAEAEKKLVSMIGEYVYDALAGQDKESAANLLQRRAPLKYWLKYYWYLLLYRTGILGNEMKRLFSPPMPLEPRNYHRA
jgi:hypothetical protein